MEGKLSLKDKKLIDILMMDSTILSTFSKDNKIPTKVEVLDDGTFVAYYTGCTWWSKLCNDNKTIPFELFAINVVAAICGNGPNRNNAVYDVLIKEVIELGLKNKDYHKVIDCIFDVCRHSLPGELRSTFLNDDTTKLNSNAYRRVVGSGRVRLNSGESFGPIVKVSFEE
jgi:hypothetical protein